MIPVGYHISSSVEDPFYEYNPSEIGERFFYYPPHTDGNYYVPYGWIDGYIRGSSYSNWWTLINGRSSIEPPIAIELSGQYNINTKEGRLDIDIFVEDQIVWDDLKLRVALTEDSIYYRAPNGTVWHNFTTRDMVPNAAGESIVLQQGSSYDFSKDFSCPEPLQPEYCRLVVWVQADGSNREVLQAAPIMVSELDQISAVDDPVELPGSFHLAQNYPNPFNARTIISYSLEHESHVELVVYDLLGQKIKTLVSGMQIAGDHQINWDGTADDGRTVSSGIYFYKLNADGISRSKRMMMIK